jgi:hypothetical protein
MPTELQSLTRQLVRQTDEASQDMHDLPAVLVGLGVPVDAGSVLMASLAEMLADARCTEFAARRLQVLVASQTDVLRRVYSQTLLMVDACRMARAKVPESDLGAALSQELEALLGAIQGEVEAAFPGDHHVGD